MVPLGGSNWNPQFLSEDGSVIIGAPTDHLSSSLYWSEATGTIGFGTLPGGHRTQAYSASADGSVVVGAVEFPGNVSKAFYWSEETGMLDLRDLLIAEGVTNLTGWDLHEARGVSADGRTIVGNSNNRPGATTIPWVVRLSAPTLLGDFNEDGTVDAADYVVWRKGLETTYTQSDYDTWRHNFGQTAGSGSVLPSAEPLSAAVPEPASALLLTLSVAALFRIRRRPGRGQ